MKDLHTIDRASCVPGFKSAQLLHMINSTINLSTEQKRNGFLKNAMGCLRTEVHYGNIKPN